MRAVVQRVTESSVTVDGQITGATDEGLVVLIGVEEGDTDKDAGYIADKVSGLRIFEDENEKMNLSVKDVGGSILAISQFTLLGDVRKGKRPSFITAEDPEIANRLYQQVCENIRNQGIKVETGIFQAHMLVKINNNGPVTILLDSRKTF
ncbi:MAG: D-aminoacyl-tRNA deacylase [Anaerovoracaceae bacterium]|nr:D-aminoacyl-tRNA deacylase [Anaerovoracaceae bacterium]MEE0182073.1 D-aminoacyl-tRNA deacylase [Anaerovoracaceae bacterium]